MKRFLAITWWLLLTVWFAAATAPALAAISAFTQLQDLGILVTDYQAYLGTDPKGNGRLAAGFVTDPVFRITDNAQVAIATIGLIVLIITRGRPVGGSSPANIVNIACFGIAAIIIAILVFGMSASMNHELDAYRSAARMGDVAEADARLAAFNTMHPIAEKMHGFRAMAVLGMVIASGFAATAPSLRDQQS